MKKNPYLYTLSPGETWDAAEKKFGKKFPDSDLSRNQVEKSTIRFLIATPKLMMNWA